MGFFFSYFLKSTLKITSRCAQDHNKQIMHTFLKLTDLQCDRMLRNRGDVKGLLNQGQFVIKMWAYLRKSGQQSGRLV